MSRRTRVAAIVTAILTAGIWLCCPAARKVQSPLVHGLAAFLIAWPIYRLVKEP
jgi:hypothetical protein